MPIGKVHTNVQVVKKYQQSSVETYKADKIRGLRKQSYNFLRLLCSYGKCITQVSSILQAVKRAIGLPDEDSKKVAYLLKDLSEQTKTVKRDIRKLENMIKWQATKLQYGEIVTKIETGIQILVKMYESTNGDRKRYEQRLIELCSGQSMTLAVENLLKGVAPGPRFLHNNILEGICFESNGNRGVMELMCFRVLLLICGGLKVIETYENLVRYDEGAMDMKNWFEDVTPEKVGALFKACQHNCKVRLEENLQEDLTAVLRSKMSKKEAAAYLSELLSEKYDWLETHIIICKDIKELHDYDLGINHVKNLKYKHRYGVIFYREEPGDRWFSDAPRISHALVPRSRGDVQCKAVRLRPVIAIPLAICKSITPKFVQRVAKKLFFK